MSSIQVSKLAQGYVQASCREACRNCRFGKERRADRMPPYDTSEWHCEKGGFFTSATAICNAYEKANGQPRVVAHPVPRPVPPLTTKEMLDLTAMVWGAPASCVENEGDEFARLIRATERVFITGKRPVDPVDDPAFVAIS